MKRTLFTLIFLLFIISACQSSTTNTNYYFAFTGESENWKLTNYEMMLTDEDLDLGNGLLEMKDVDEYETDYFSFNTYIVKSGEEERVHGGSVSGHADLKKQGTGTIEGRDGKTVAFHDIQHIYMDVEWRDLEKEEDVSERINLYEKQADRDSFLRDE